MKRYRNFVMLEQMKECIRSGQQAEALEIADTLDAHSIKNYSDVNLMADLYIENSNYNKAYTCLRELYQRRKTRSVLMQLINLSVRMKNVNAAEKYFADFKAISGNDFYNYIFRYNIDKLEGKSLEVQIDSLEKLRAAEPIDVWAYELAKLYHKAGMGDKCIKECDDIEIWFGDGVYVDRARALKAYYKGELNINEMSSSPKQQKPEQQKTEQVKPEPNTDSEAEYEKHKSEENSPENPENKQIESEGDQAIGLQDVLEIRSEEPETYPEESIKIYGSEQPEKSEESVEPEQYSEADRSEEPELTAEPGQSEGSEQPEEPELIEGSGQPEEYEQFEGSEQAELSEQNGELEQSEQSDDHKNDTRENAFTNRFSEEEDDFAEEIRDYEDDVAAENTTISIDSDLVEGEDAWISTFLEEEENELAQMIRVELQKEKAAEKRWRGETEPVVPAQKEKAEVVKAVEAAEPVAEAAKVKEAEGAAETVEGIESVAETESTEVTETIEESEETEITEGTENIIEAAEDSGIAEEATESYQFEPEESLEVQSEAESAEVETVDIDISLKNGKEIEKGSILDTVLSKNGDKLEDYFEFYAYQPDVRSQLIKTLEPLLNPQIKNMCLVVTGTDEKEKNVIIKGIVRILSSSGFIANKQIYNSDAVKLTAESLRSKSEKLPGSCLVIRSAGKMTKETAEALLELDEKMAGKTTVVLTDTRSEMSSMFRDNRELNSMFPQRIHIPDFDEKDIEDLLYYKINDSGYRLAAEAQPELKRLIHEYCKAGVDPVNKAGSMIAAAIDRVDTRNAKSFLNLSDKTGFKENNIIRLSDIKTD